MSEDKKPKFLVTVVIYILIIYFLWLCFHIGPKYHGIINGLFN